ncbi:amino acid ABC transporter permease [Saccharothrix sp.]|uniref:amino acid ABC transporter permease n=1 Tax=Saccharothrix sp. TaxID=1873460 RepID=UPI002810AE7F|nr:amino acid ABC transporter permease [Saccharothrix sp.]
MSVSAQPRLREPDDDLSTLKVVPTRHPWRWVGVVVVFVLLAQFVHGLATNPGWDWPTFAQYFTARSILRAVLVTLELTLCGTAIGFALGVVPALMRLSRSRFLSGVSWAYVWAFRSIPLIVQLLFWFNISYLYAELHFGIPFGPAFFGVDTKDLISPMGAAVLGLGLHQAAYAAEIVRSGIISVDDGQLDAAAALGIPKSRQFRRIVLPQAMRSILPNAANEVISLFKGTSIVSVVAIGELFYDEEGERLGRAGGRGAEPPDRQWEVRRGAGAVGVDERGRAGVGDQPAGVAEELSTG